jgi:Protein of unknown function (DUF3108)
MNTSQKPFWRTPIAIMLAVSAIAHALTYWVIPHGIAAWNAPKATQFDAVIAQAEPVTIDPAVLAPPPAATPAPPRPRKPRAPKPAPVIAKSEANFVAPENAIAVAPAAVPAVTSVEATPLETGPATANENLLKDLAKGELLPTPNVTATDTASAKSDSGKTEPSAEPPVKVAAATNTSASTAPTVEKQIEKIADRPDFPARLTIAYKLSSSVADGVVDFSWKRNGAQYEIESTIQPTGLFASMFAGTFKQSSQGEVTADGIAPSFFSMQRGDTPADTAEFKHATKELKIIKHGETHLMPLPSRMQDMQSFLFQMAHDAPTMGDGSDARITVNVTNARKVYQYKFFRVGEETVNTRMGPVTAIHLKSESSNPEDVYEVWLAPKHFYMPVKLKFYMGRFAVEQVATRIGGGN